MKKLIAFNWKMSPASLKEAEKLFKVYLKSSSTKRSTLTADFIVCPPFVYLEKLIASAVAKGYGGLRFASQDIFWENQGAYTGEISPAMLKDLGIGYVLIGHSERRQYLKETDEMINKKIKAALSAGLKVILCVGEDLKIRKKGKRAVESFIKGQLQKDLKNSEFLIHNSKLRNHFVVAYEPIWAIGTGVPCAPKDASETIRFIKDFLSAKPYTLNPSVLYGGSVNGQNVKDFVKLKEIDGALVGGASLKKEEVKKIIKLTK